MITLRLSRGIDAVSLDIPVQHIEKATLAVMLAGSFALNVILVRHSMKLARYAAEERNRKMAPAWGEPVQAPVLVIEAQPVIDTENVIDGTLG